MAHFNRLLVLFRKKSNFIMRLPCKGKFLFPVKAMSIVFRAKYVAQLRKQIRQKTSCVIDCG